MTTKDRLACKTMRGATSIVSFGWHIDNALSPALFLCSCKAYKKNSTVRDEIETLQKRTATTTNCTLFDGATLAHN
jgi:hypothetical protein